MLSYLKPFVYLFGAALVVTSVTGQAAVKASETKAPAAARASATPSVRKEPLPDNSLLPDYRIGPGDVLAVDVWKEPDASTASIVVRPDGRLSLPLVGELLVAGMTPQGLQDELTTRYNEMIQNARVNVAIREINSQRVFVIGEVRREGTIRISTPVTVLQALADSGGLTDYAKKSRIYILRTRDNRQMRLPFDYDAVVHGRKVEQNIILMPGDTVVVPR
jgi:polysaccharide export outer membrane protein